MRALAKGVTFYGAYDYPEPKEQAWPLTSTSS